MTFEVASCDNDVCLIKINVVFFNNPKRGHHILLPNEV